MRSLCTFAQLNRRTFAQLNRRDAFRPAVPSPRIPALPVTFLSSLLADLVFLCHASQDASDVFYDARERASEKLARRMATDMLGAWIERVELPQASATLSTHLHCGLNAAVSQDGARSLRQKCRRRTRATVVNGETTGKDSSQG
eukprot:6208185-Pleurochrysis_carterae.AAC.3